MCGVFGWSFTEAPKKSDFVVLASVLATLNDERGGDAWGYYAHGMKDPIKGLGLFGDAKQSMRDLIQYNKLIGHTRYKTVGDSTIANAHPFRFGNIVGAHNGGVFNHDSLDRKYNRNFAVDSMHIFKHIEEGKWTLDDLTGYGTIHFIKDDEPNVIYIGRFASGDLAIARTKYGWIWSSSSLHLKIALKIAGIVPTSKVYEPPASRLYKIHEDNIFRQTKITMDVQHAPKGSRSQYQYGGGTYCRPYNNPYISHSYTPSTTTTTNVKKAESAKIISCPSGILREIHSSAGGKRKVYVFTNGEVKEEERDPEVTEFTEAHLADLDKIFPPKQTSLALVSKQTSTTTTSYTSDTEDQDTEGKFRCPDCKANDTSFRCEVCFSCSICCQTTDMSMMMHEHCALEDEDTKDEDEETETGRISRYLCESCYSITNMFCAACRDCPDCCTCVDPKVVINE